MKRKLLNECTIRFPAFSRNESLSRSVSAAFAAQFDPTAADIAAVKIAVSEAVTNAVVHAYTDRDRAENARVEMIVRLYEGGFLRIIIKDKGRGISDVEQAMKPEFTTAPESEERSGLGFTVMSSFMDSIKVRSAVGRGTTVTLEKQLSTYEYVENE
ncbi:MAG: anti-sigma F factor [Oscillospiraceae bacterium]|nr:anti-sigma F factor [Oscillospiraceae bacterium]